MSTTITLMVTLTSVDITKFHDYSLNQEKVPGTKRTLSSVCTSCDCVNPQTMKPPSYKPGVVKHWIKQPKQ